MPYNNGTYISGEILSSFREAVERTRMTEEIRAWSVLGIIALAISGLFAFLLALSRIPGIENTFPWPIGFFEKGLVIHVVFSFVVWFLVNFAILTGASTSNAVPAAQTSIRLASLGWPAIFLAYTGAFLMALAGLMDRGEASLNNYIPVIIDPLYYMGLICFVIALVLVIIRFTANISGNRPIAGPLIDATIAGSLIFIAAISCFLFAWFPRMNNIIDIRFNEDVFWGGGHVLQYLNTVLMITGWYLLCYISIGKPPIPRVLLRIILLLCTLPALYMPTFYLTHGYNSGEAHQLFTDMQYLLAPPVILMVVSLIIILFRLPAGIRLIWNDMCFQCLFLSFLTFFIGGYFGLFVDGADTRTPAHYHAVIAAINLVLMGLFFQFLLPLMSRTVRRSSSTTILIWLYACGQIIASIGLFLAGGYGAPRKIAGEAQGLEGTGSIVGLYMNGFGAAIAVIGGIMFIWSCARPLLQEPSRAINRS